MVPVHPELIGVANKGSQARRRFMISAAPSSSAIQFRQEFVRQSRPICPRFEKNNANPAPQNRTNPKSIFGSAFFDRC
jgi:hypothetical protein